MSRALFVAATLLLPLVAAVPAQADGEIVKAAAARPVEGSYIVTLKETQALQREGVPEAANRLAALYAAGVGFVYSQTLKGFQALLSEEKARKLAAHPAVAAVEQDVTVSASDTQQNPPSWGIDRIDQAALPLSNSYTYNGTASNVTAYILDTGILNSHVEFGGRARSGHDFVDNDSDATDCNGHGTHVAGTVGGTSYGVAKAVNLVGVRVLDCAGNGTMAGVIAGVDWVTANAVKPAVANMSLGGGANAALDEAVERSIASGITYALAAGNESTNACNRSPARTPNAITTGATTSSDSRDTTYSNFGPCVDLFAPGSDITSTWIGADTATRTISGTSMASPHTAGAVALYLADHPTATPADVANAVISSAAPGVVTNAGTGSPTRLLQTAITAPVPCTPVTNATPVATKPLGTVTSTVAVACPGNASPLTKVTVDISHTHRGALTIDLVSPDGTTVRLQQLAPFDLADDIKTTYTADLSAESRTGTWTLRVQDHWFGNKGAINTWTLGL